VAGPYASLHLASDRQPRQHPTTQFFTGWMPFLPPNQQCQSTEGTQLSMTLLLIFCSDSRGARERCCSGHTEKHTHPFNGPFSGTTRVSRYQKGKTNLDFTEARDSEWQRYQLGQCKSAPRSRQITTPVPQHSVFYRPDALPATQPTASKH